MVGMDGRGALGKGFAWSTGEREILGHCVQLSVYGEKAVRRISARFFLHSFEN